MKKKFLAFLFAVCLIIPCGFILAACGGDGDKSDHKHTMVTVSAKAATCTETGNVEYYRCDGCSKTFSDANGNTPITNISIPALGHIGGNANCVQSAVCERCYNTYGGLGEHDFGEFTQTKAPTCTEAGENTAVCLVCEETKTEQIPALGHSGEWKVVAEPRCFDDGEKQRICTVCDALEEEKIASFNSHELQDSTCVSGKECTRCNYVEGAARGHAFGEWMITTEPGCTENGEKERACLVCGEKETSVVYKTGHSYDEWSVITEPTCTENGEKESYCSECNHHTTSTIYKKGHSGEWVETKTATCTVNGEQQRTCEECGTLETKTIHAGHDYSSWEVTLEATCTTKGEKERYCQQCGDIVTSEISMTAHSYNWVVTQEASCTENGVKVGTCSECGQESNGTINKLGHNMQGGTCITPSTCSRCDFVEYNDHLFGERYEIINPDCERHGIEHAKCEVCGYIEEYQTTSLGHNYGAFEICKEPTCTEFGRERRICTVCEKAQDRQVDMLPHNAGEWTIVEEATCTTEGLQKKTCLDCGSFLTDEVIPALGHNFLDATCLEPKICERCASTEGEPIEHQLGEYKCELCDFQFRYSDGSEFFTYTLSDDGNSYWISGFARNCSLSKILTPDTYNGKPVIGIGELNSSYSNYDNFQIYLSNSIEFIAENAFENTKVERVFIGKNSKMKTIGNYAFAVCYYLKSVNLPESVTRIEKYAFSDCTNLTSINIPENVTNIGDGAFSGCSNLTSIEIPESVTNIGDGAFSGCIFDSVKCNIVGEGYTLVNGILNITTMHTSTSGDPAWSNVAELVLAVNFDNAGSFDTIGTSAFAYCTNLTSINIPEGVISIGEYAFSDCKNLESINIPEGVTSIGEFAFFGCSGLTDVYYSGTEEQWSAITKNSGNSYLTSATIHYNYTGE